VIFDIYRPIGILNEYIIKNDNKSMD